jgi:hypothetical protein
MSIYNETDIHTSIMSADSIQLYGAESQIIFGSNFLTTIDVNTNIDRTLTISDVQSDIYICDGVRFRWYPYLYNNYE